MHCLFNSLEIYFHVFQLQIEQTLKAVLEKDSLVITEAKITDHLHNKCYPANRMKSKRGVSNLLQKDLEQDDMVWKHDVSPSLE